MHLNDAKYEHFSCFLSSYQLGLNSKYLSIADILYLNEFQYIAKGISDMSKISNYDDWLVSIKRNNIVYCTTAYHIPVHIIPKHMHHYIARLCIWLVEWRHVTMLGHILGWKKFSSSTLFSYPTFSAILLGNIHTTTVGRLIKWSHKKTIPNVPKVSN